MVLAKQPQRLADRVPANRKPLAELFFGRKLRADRMDPLHDLILQRTYDLEIQRLFGFVDDRVARTLRSLSYDGLARLWFSLRRHGFSAKFGWKI
jgi:hypothetical protein